MKYNWFGFAGVSLLLMLLVGSAAAQQPILTANVPFPFVVNNRVLPAGSYTVEETSPDLLVLRDGSSTTFIHTLSEDSSKPIDAVNLTFQQYGHTYVLSQVSGNGNRWEIPISRSEKTLAKDGAPVEVGGNRP